MRKVFLALLFTLILGCSFSLLTTKPNPTYVANIPSLVQSLPSKERIGIKATPTGQEGRASPLFEKMYQFDSELAIELGRIPEFQDGVSEKEVLGLERFLSFTETLTEDEKKALKGILSIGRPEYRKFCSLLQGLFWLAEKGELSREDNPLKDYSLEKLLDRIWTFQIEYTKEEAINIIKNLRDKKNAERLLSEAQGDEKKLNEMVNMFRKFTMEDLFEDKNIFKKYGISRWSDFGVVVDRLNSPELVDYYERKNFNYADFRGRNDSYDVFTRKYGDCVAISLFTEYCLSRAGYKAYIIRVVSPSGRAPSGHRVCYFEWNNKGYIMDNGRPDHQGIIEKEKYLKWYPLVGYGVNP